MREPLDHDSKLPSQNYLKNLMQQDLLDIINKVKNINLENLKREGRDYEFTDVYFEIKSIYDKILELENSEDWVNSLPLSRKQDLLNHLSNFYSIIEAINNFTPASMGNAQSERDNLANNIRNEYNEFYDKLIQPLKVEEISRRSSKSSVSTISKKAESELTEIQKIKNNVEELLESTKKATAQTGLNVFSKVFDDQAEENKNLSKKWLIISIVLLFILITIHILIMLESAFLLSKNMNPIQSLTLLIARILPVTLGYYALYQSVKNYNVNMHLYTVNRHRSNVLKTFESFVKSTDDPRNRDAVLIKAAESIFSPGDSGYLSNKDTKEGLEFVQFIDSLRKN